MSPRWTSKACQKRTKIMMMLSTKVKTSMISFQRQLTTAPVTQLRTATWRDSRESRYLNLRSRSRRQSYWCRDEIFSKDWELPSVSRRRLVFTSSRQIQTLDNIFRETTHKCLRDEDEGAEMCLTMFGTRVGTLRELPRKNDTSTSHWFLMKKSSPSWFK